MRGELLARPRPKWSRWLRIGVLVYVVWVVFIGYAWHRGCRSPFGGDSLPVATTLLAAVIKGVLGSWLSWIMVVGLGVGYVSICVDMGTRNQRLKHGQCETCGYQLLPAQARCPECGNPPKIKTAPPLRTWWFVVLLFAGWAGAGLAAEMWVRADEYVFRRQVEASGGDERMHRQRWWPNGSARLWYEPDEGYSMLP